MSDNAGCGLFALVGAAAAIFWGAVYAEPMIAGESVVYMAFCPTHPVNGHCVANEEWSGRTTFKADFSGQFVLHWSDDGNVEKYKNCAVKDSQNWSCSLGKNSFDTEVQEVMHGGILIGTMVAINDQFYQTTPLKWYDLWLTNYLNGKQRS